jgi:hypothetical protein
LDNLLIHKSLSDRIGRKWVLAWLTVLLAVVSLLSHQYRRYGLTCRGTASSWPQRTGGSGLSLESLLVWATGWSKRNVSSTLPRSLQSLFEGHYSRATLLPTRSEVSLVLSVCRSFKLRVSALDIHCGNELTCSVSSCPGLQAYPTIPMDLYRSVYHLVVLPTRDSL